MSLSRKLCPWMSLALVTLGCGKKINEAETKPASNVEPSQGNITYVIDLESKNGSRQKFKAPKGLNFKIPEYISVTKGSQVDRAVEIRFNVDEYYPELYDYKCSYYPSKEDSELDLVGCFDSHGRTLGDVTGHDFYVKKDNFIEVEIFGNMNPEFSLNITLLKN